MAQFVDDSVMDAALAVVIACDEITICKSQPANYAAIAGEALMATAVASVTGPFAGTSDGRRADVAGFVDAPVANAVLPTQANHVALANSVGGVLVLVTTIAVPKDVQDGQQMDLTGFSHTIRDV